MVDTLPTLDASGPNTGGKHPTQANWNIPETKSSHSDGLLLASILAIVALPKLPLSRQGAFRAQTMCDILPPILPFSPQKETLPGSNLGGQGLKPPCSFVRRFLFLCFSPSSACIPFFLLSTWPAAKRGLARNLNLVKPQLPLAHQTSETRPSTNQGAPQLPLPLPHGRSREEVAEVTFKPKSSGWTGFVHATPLENTYSRQEWKCIVHV